MILSAPTSRLLSYNLQLYRVFIMMGVHNDVQILQGGFLKVIFTDLNPLHFYLLWKLTP